MASARTMRAAGAAILSMPDNYYDDLDARFDLPAERLQAMREHSILYDRDDHGEYLHFFTEMLGSRVFFEVVQRTGAYTGFGDPNGVPVRMAAHRERR
jgi:4-hydroxyphenylpyruvate dioxygenase